jgi:hypothetical protein
MLIDTNGIPHDTGATDYEDSARLAGMMALFDHPLAPDLTKYVTPEGNYVRHPYGVKYAFSRDQLMPLIAGLYKQGRKDLIKPNTKPENKDWMSPSHKDHVSRCSGGKDSWVGLAWLYLDIMWHSHLDILAEPNQLIAMLMVAGPSYVRLWKRSQKNWRQAITVYWAGWRGEADFAQFLINKLESI